MRWWLCTLSAGSVSTAVGGFALTIPKLPVNNQCLLQTTWMDLSLVCHHDRDSTGALHSLSPAHRDTWQCWWDLWLLRTVGVCGAEPPQGSWVWVKVDHQWIQQHRDAESPLLCFGKAGLDLPVPGVAPGGLGGAHVCWQRSTSANSIESQS